MRLTAGVLYLGRAGWCAALAALTALSLSSPSGAQTSQVSTDYLMTLYAPLEAAQEIDSSLDVSNVGPGGWVKDPRISGKLVAPAGDWFRTLPSGAGRLDVRADLHFL